MSRLRLHPRPTTAMAAARLHPVADYQGNIRAIASGDRLLQTNHYYPYGLPFAEGLSTANHPFKYGGKELLTDYSLNIYDFHARMQFPAGGIFDNPDSQSESYYPLSPYIYCAGNPIIFNDPTGNAINFFSGFVGGVIGFGINAGIETASQLIEGNGLSAKKILAAGAEGAVVGGLAGLTFGSSLLAEGGIYSAMAASSTISVIGGSARRAVLQTPTTATDVCEDACTGAVGGIFGSATAKIISNEVNALSNHIKGEIGETVTEIKYLLKGYVSMDKDKRPTGLLTPVLKKEQNALFDFKMKNVITGKTSTVESKFGTSELTPNQRAAIKYNNKGNEKNIIWNGNVRGVANEGNTGFSVIIDRTTPYQIGNAAGIGVVCGVNSSNN